MEAEEQEGAETEKQGGGETGTSVAGQQRNREAGKQTGTREAGQQRNREAGKQGSREAGSKEAGKQRSIEAGSMEQNIRTEAKRRSKAFASRRVPRRG